jgi:hypothetical protein
MHLESYSPIFYHSAPPPPRARWSCAGPTTIGWLILLLCVGCLAVQPQGALNSGGAGSWPRYGPQDVYLRLDQVPNRVAIRDVRKAQ